MEIEEIKTHEELVIIMQGLLDDDERIDFLWRYIAERPHANHEMMAQVYEALAKMYVRQERSRPDVYEKAGEHWEANWSELLSRQGGMKKQRDSLRNALKNYKIASDIYWHTNSTTATEAIQSKIREIRYELRGYGMTTRSFIMGGSILSFIVSIIFFTNTITGFIVAEAITPTTSIGLGVFLFLVSLAGFFFVAKWK